MDRVIVQPGAIPQDTDVLNAAMFAMMDAAYQNMAMLGTSTVVAGLTCSPTSPTASLNVIIGVGSIFTLDEIDASAYGSLGTNTNTIMKQGILSSPVTLTITPPVTTGYSQIYLVQAVLQDIDSGSVVESYYNSANPAQPYAGPNNSGSSNYTERLCKCTISLVAGTPATTGSEVAPSPSAGNTGLYTITVSNGTTQITSGLISQLVSAPFFPTLPQVPYDVQNGTFVYAGQDTGAANAYVITFEAGQPIPSTYKAGMKVVFKALNANTGSSTINVNGLGLVTIHRASGVALASGDIASGQVVELTYDGTYFQMANYLGAGANTNTSTVVDLPYVADSGTQNAIIATFSPAITSGEQVAGLAILVKLAYAITGACTINVNGLGSKNVTLGDGTRPPYNVFVAGEIMLLIYDGTEYQIAGTSAGMFYKQPIANYTIYVNASTGSDTLYDGTSATVTGVGSAGPLKTISKAVSVAFGYAPSQYSITISVAPGTYNETVQTPRYAGPNLIIDGGSYSSVTVNAGNSNYNFTVSGPNTMTVQNITVTNSGPTDGGGAFTASSGATINVINCQSLSIPGAVCSGGYNGTCNIYSFVISGSCYTFAWAIGNGVVEFVGGGNNITITTAISVTDFVTASAGGAIICNNTSPTVFANSSYVSGSKYLATINGTISTSGLGYNYFPGSIAGSTASGGQYNP